MNVCFYCFLILFFVLTCFLNNGWSHQSNTDFFYSTKLSALEAIFFVHTHIFFWQILKFWGFSIILGSSFGWHLCQTFGWAGSELYVRTRITEFPCQYLKPKLKISIIKMGSVLNICYKIWYQKINYTCCWVLDVIIFVFIVVWFCFWSWLAFLIMADIQYLVVALVKL